jgi:hypothetical protein
VVYSLGVVWTTSSPRESGAYALAGSVIHVIEEKEYLHRHWHWRQMGHVVSESLQVFAMSQGCERPEKLTVFASLHAQYGSVHAEFC